MSVLGIQQNDSVMQTYISVFFSDSFLIGYASQYSQKHYFNIQDMEATWMSIDRGMDKQDVVYTMEY